MIIFLLAPANSSHTLKWANSLASSGLKVYLFSFDPISGKYNKSINIIVFKYTLGVVESDKKRC